MILKTLAYNVPDTNNLVPIAQCVDNIGHIFTLISRYSQAAIIWATSTPINQALAHAGHANYQNSDPCPRSVPGYNAAALAVCKAQNVTMNDLYSPQ